MQREDFGGLTEVLTKTFPPGEITVQALDRGGHTAAEKTVTATTDGEELEVELP